MNLTPQKEPSCHIFKLAIFSKFFHEQHNHVKLRYNIKTFLNTSLIAISNIVFLTFESTKSICQGYRDKVSSLESPGVRRIWCWPYLFQLLCPNQTESDRFKLRKLQLRREIQTYLPMLKIKVAFSGEVWSNIFKFLRLTKLPSQTKSKFAYDRLIYLPSFSSWVYVKYWIMSSP